MKPFRFEPTKEDIRIELSTTYVDGCTEASHYDGSHPEGECKTVLHDLCEKRQKACIESNDFYEAASLQAPDDGTVSAYVLSSFADLASALGDINVTYKIRHSDYANCYKIVRPFTPREIEDQVVEHEYRIRIAAAHKEWQEATAREEAAQMLNLEETPS